MRPRALRPLLALLVSLLVAGCSVPAAEEGGAAAAEEAPVEPAAAEGPPSTPTASPAGPSPPPTPTPATSPAPSPQEPPAPPAPPPKLPWNLSGEARLGYVAAAGAGGGDVPTQGQSDAAHCPDAALSLPAGAKELRIAIRGDAVDPATPAAGQYRISIRSPDGTNTTLEPVMGDLPAAESPQRELIAATPVAGDWELHADPVGPAAQQVWTLSISVNGESEVPPTILLVVPRC